MNRHVNLPNQQVNTPHGVNNQGVNNQGGNNPHVTVPNSNSNVNRVQRNDSPKVITPRGNDRPRDADNNNRGNRRDRNDRNDG